MAKKIVPQEPCVFCSQNPCVCDAPAKKQAGDPAAMFCNAVGPDCECHDEPMLCTRQKLHTPRNAHYNLTHKKSWSKDRA